MTINALFQETVRTKGAKTALMAKGEGRQWNELTYGALAEKVAALAAELAERGITKGDRVALMSENQPGWVITDLAVLALGAIVVPIYPTLPPPQIAYIVNNSGAKALVAGDAKLLAKAQEARKETPSLAFLVGIQGGDPADASVLALDDLLAAGAGKSAPVVEVTSDDVASFVYTSGTTGDPKGAMLTHGNIASNVEGAYEFFLKECGGLDNDDTLLSFLPLSHIFERTAGYYLAVRCGARIAYSEGVRTLVNELAEVQPTLMFCVPRVWEAIQGRVLEKAEKEGKADILAKALEVGRKYAEKTLAGESVGLVLKGEHAVFDRLVYSKVRETFGGKMRYLVSGGAALNPDTNWFYLSVGLPLMQGYGLTESSPVIAISPPKRNRVGYVGIAIPGVEIKIAPDGEICSRGPHIMKGYWQNEEATRQMIDDDGWLHTGDIGELSPDGFLRITDRKKDIIVLANGKNVAPQPIEGKLKESPFISDIVLIGDKQSIVTALVLPNKEKLGEWAKAQGLTFDSDEALLARPEAKKKIKEEIDARSTALADFERVKRFTLLNATFSIETGELTPTLKVKRKVILQKWAKEVAELRGDE